MTRHGVLRAAAFLAVGIAFPFVFSPAWLVNIGVLTLMYAALATSWNLFSGYTGYITLGQVAFFGLGAYTLAIAFEHFGIGSGYNPFYALPLVGAGEPIATARHELERDSLGGEALAQTGAPLVQVGRRRAPAPAADIRQPARRASGAGC